MRFRVPTYDRTQSSGLMAKLAGSEGHARVPTTNANQPARTGNLQPNTARKPPSTQQPIAKGRRTEWAGDKQRSWYGFPNYEVCHNPTNCRPLPYTPVAPPEAFAIGACAAKPIGIPDGPNDSEPDSHEPIVTDATNPITISDSEDENAHPSAIEGQHQLPAHVPDNWPSRVPYWTTNRGHQSAHFSDIDLGTCKCSRKCRSDDCDNAKTAVFCGDNNCAAGPACGNRLLDCDSLVLMRCIKDIGVKTVSEIPRGTIIGEYCGQIIPHSQLTVDNVDRGFVLKFKSRDTNGERVFVDAAQGGSMGRFVNHSCSPNSRFEEGANRTTRKIVIVTQRRVRASEVISVRYNKNVSFVCLCGEANCQSRM